MSLKDSSLPRNSSHTAACCSSLLCTSRTSFGWLHTFFRYCSAYMYSRHRASEHIVYVEHAWAINQQNGTRQTNKHTHRDTTHTRVHAQTYNTARCMYRQQSLPQNHHIKQTSSRVEVIRKAMKDTDEHTHQKEGMRNYIRKCPNA